MIKAPRISIKDKLPKFTKMPRIEKELTACLQCGYCINVCEAHNQTPWESVTPRGKIYYINQLYSAGGLDKALKKEVTLNPYFVDAMYRCTGCGNCEVVCHANIHLVEFWETMRKWIVEQGAGPMSAHKSMAAKVAKVHNPYGEPTEKRDNWWPKEVEKAEVPDVIFFAGCTGAYRLPTVPQMGVRVLARGGVKISSLGTEEWCCSSPLLRTGTHDSSLECAETIVEKADGMGAKDMVMTCSGCYKTISSDFGKFYARVGQNVYHFSQYAEMLINARKLPLNHEFKAKVTYHDPCHMGRHMGVFDPPRNVLKKIKGIELVEMERTRENSGCCGAGGGYKSQYNDFAVNVAVDRVREAEATGADIIVTCCPFCVTNLSQGAKKIGSKIKVMDLSEVLLAVTAPVEAKPEAPKAEPKPVAEAPKAEAPIAAKPVVEAPKAEPKPVVEAPKAVPAAELSTAAEPEPLADADASDDEVFEDAFTDMSPGALIRRAAWNKGLRCRKDYGPYAIPVAFVKSKVAVYVLKDGESVNASDRAAAENDGWAVLSFLEKDVTDGESQAAEIRAAVKENLKTLRKHKK
ncbi:MAG: 4Fe-4S dicluster domain-containing protein [Candidatus Methanoplasma sp.]|jgi:Fe-S oxidoreductase|nr:4Fe-4S dicluster domain-containing protein [Candidatus Methanoplasma sp.]